MARLVRLEVLTQYYGTYPQSQVVILRFQPAVSQDEWWPPVIHQKEGGTSSLPKAVGLGWETLYPKIEHLLSASFSNSSRCLRLSTRKEERT